MKAAANKLQRGHSITIAVSVTLLCSAFASLGWSGVTYEISWSTVDGGGAMFTTNGALELSATVGQLDAGGPMTGGDLELVGGFWAITGEVGATGDADGDGDVDLDDHAQFTDCMGGPGAPPSPTAGGFSPQDCLHKFDFDKNGKVDLKDWKVFIEIFSP